MSLSMNFFSKWVSATVLVATLVCAGSVHAAAVFGTQRSPEGDVELLYIADDVSGKVHIQLKGPSDRWFAWGFNNVRMAGTYTLIVQGSPAQITERRLGNHNAGSLLSSSLENVRIETIGNSTYISCVRDVSNNDFTFSTTPGSLPVIWGRGNGLNLAYHGFSNKAATQVTTAATERPRMRSIHVVTNMAVLSLTNLTSGLNYYLEFRPNVAEGPWLLMQNVTDATPDLSLPLPNQNMGFFRVRPGIPRPPLMQ